MKLIPLNTVYKTKKSNKYFAKVDDEDYEYLMQWKWFAKKARNTLYAIRTDKSEQKQKTVIMHRVILEINDSKIFIDHKDHDGLNNQKSNIRYSSNSQNQGNRIVLKNGTSDFHGVSYVKDRDKWIAQIKIKNKQTNLGRFDTAEEAAIARDNAAKLHFGKFATLNFK